MSVNILVSRIWLGDPCLFIDGIYTVDLADQLVKEELWQNSISSSIMIADKAVPTFWIMPDITKKMVTQSCIEDWQLLNVDVFVFVLGNAI